MSSWLKKVVSIRRCGDTGKFFFASVADTFYSPSPKGTLRERASYGRRLQSDRSAYFQSQIR
ncbi:MAG: hypothetical protein V7K68_05360 [Nostoc sp.]|uniref:hypothetical protein n=1 Tax=Nostoc sp. TaxID=1180 RepID=UPI002FFC2A40